VRAVHGKSTALYRNCAEESFIALGRRDAGIETLADKTMQVHGACWRREFLVLRLFWGTFCFFCATAFVCTVEEERGINFPGVQCLVLYWSNPQR
jgi:hypothetical protein